MKTYIFPWQCDEAYGELELEISKEEVDLIEEAYRDGFGALEESDTLEGIWDRAVLQLGFYDPDAGQDIRIYFPEEITDKIDEEEE